ncbi:glycosyltransferase [Litorihabitans aurantiacus]|uniref:Glycosyltransferase n=1 Tax=Litorihabitans aurantiacus TaxID=1930061 RepID=A0AA37XE66_9MICO|nr:glycosyltransferase [Litorihabitans aurantiacus]GMA31517.1 hypothetical protein GCM10025875_15090 [Litorihabitans aurantiacus]
MSAPPWGTTVPGNRWDLATESDAHAHALRRSVTVVVTHYDQPGELARTLSALARQTYPAHLVQVVVADDGSPVPPSVPDGVALVRQEDRGFRAAAARNLGASAATGDLLCFLDADTAPEPDYLARLLRLPALLPEAVTVGRRRHADLAASAAPVERAGPAHELPEPSWLTRAYADSRDLLDADDRSYRFVISAVLACSRWFFEQVGGFDESFDTYGGEDWEWAHRAWAAGGVLAHVRDAVAWHDGPEWAGREGASERRRRKNAETLRLAHRITVPGSRPRALLTGGVEELVVLERVASPSQALVCVDSVLLALPHARVVVPSHVHGPLRGDPRVLLDEPDGVPRVRIDVTDAVRVRDASGLREAVALLRDDVARVRLGEHVTLTAGRAVHRRRRWGSLVGWQDLAREAPWLEPVADEPELAAWLGGWDD